MTGASKKQKLSNTAEPASSSKQNEIPSYEGSSQKANTNNDNGEIYYNIAIELYKMKCYDKALNFFRRAADRGHSLAQNEIGVLYRYGLGIPKDYKLAMYWFIISFFNDKNTAAQGNIGTLYHLGLGVPKDIPKAIEWYTKSADRGHSVYQFCLGQIYEEEEMVKDLQKSVNWYKKALDNGLKSAGKDFIRLLRAGYFPTCEEKEKAQGEDNIEASKSAENIKTRALVENVEASESVANVQIADSTTGAQANESLENVEIDRNNEPEQLPFLSQNKEMIKKLEEGFQSKLDVLEKEKAERQKLLEEKIDEIKQLKKNFAYYKAGLENDIVEMTHTISSKEKHHEKNKT